MGYESKLYVVQKHSHYLVSDCYLEKIAVFYMSNCPCLASLFGKAQIVEDNSRLYDTDGNTVITEDRYGDKLTILPIKDVIICIEKAMNTDDYRRLAPLLTTLKTLYEQEQNGIWVDGQLCVVHYGY